MNSNINIPADKRVLAYTKQAQSSQALIHLERVAIEQMLIAYGVQDDRVTWLDSSTTTFNGLLEAIESGEFAALFVYDGTRISRETEKLQRLTQTMKKFSMTVQTRSMDFDLADPVGEYMLIFDTLSIARKGHTASLRTKTAFARQRATGTGRYAGKEAE